MFTSNRLLLPFKLQVVYCRLDRIASVLWLRWISKENPQGRNISWKILQGRTWVLPTQLQDAARMDKATIQPEIKLGAYCYDFDTVPLESISSTRHFKFNIIYVYSFEHETVAEVSAVIASSGSSCHVLHWKLTGFETCMSAVVLEAIIEGIKQTGAPTDVMAHCTAWILLTSHRCWAFAFVALGDKKRCEYSAKQIDRQKVTARHSTEQKRRVSRKSPHQSVISTTPATAWAQTCLQSLILCMGYSTGSWKYPHDSSISMLRGSTCNSRSLSLL